MDVVITKDSSLTLDPDEAAIMDEVNVRRTPLDPFINKEKTFRSGPPPEPFESEEGPYPDDEFPPEEEDFGPKPSEGYATIEDEKADLLNKIARLEKKGFKTSGKLNIYSDIEQLRTEYKRITFQIESDQAVKVARRLLIACVTGVEFLNKRFDPFDIHLDGWSENVMESIEDYDSVFEELHAKYKDKMKVAPEIKLIMMVGGSAMMFHLTKSIMKSTGIDTGKVFKENPDILNNLMEQVKRAQQQKPQEDTPPGVRRDMRGPPINLASMMGGFMPPPQPMNTRPEKPAQVPSDDDVSDIVSVVSTDTKDLTIKTGSKRRTKKKEVTI